MSRSALRFLVPIFAIATLLAFWSGSSSAADSDTNVRMSLGGYPVCEASAAIVVPCTHPNKKCLKAGDSQNDLCQCLLVGDNEENDRIFLFEIRDDKRGVYLKNRREIYLTSLPPTDKKGPFELSDIEALVLLPLLPSELILYGSHSRNKSCSEKGKRRIFAHGVLKAREIGKGSKRPIKSPSIPLQEKKICKQLFDDGQDPAKQKVCKAIEHREQRAELAARQPEDMREEACKAEPPAFNLEGAVAIPQADVTARVWIGLRAPLVDDKAFLLRQEMNRDAFKFDAVAFIDLRGRGIRELTFDAAGKVWGIAGPVADGDEPHILWHIEANELKHGATIQPTIVGELPSFSEGLAISRQNLFVLIDGNQPKKSNPMTCQTDSEYIVRRIPE